MKISVISPSFNCAGLIRRSIESVMSQIGAEIEHIVVDGASTDGTVDILKEYQHIKWVSEPDNGEAEALNKALRMTTGEIITWLNVDDCYFSDNVFKLVAAAATQDSEAAIFYGNVLQVNDKDDYALVRAPTVPLNLHSAMRWFNDLNTFQPAIFYRSECIKNAGYFREDLNFAIDYEYMLRTLSLGFKYYYIDEVLAKATLFRSGAKSSASMEDQHRVWYEQCKEFQRFLSFPERVFYWRDYYRYRLKYYDRYQSSVDFPDDEAELRGFLIALLEAREYQNALVVVENGLKLFPELPELYWALTEIVINSDSPEKAHEIFKQAEALGRKRIATNNK